MISLFSIQIMAHGSRFDLAVDHSSHRRTVSCRGHSSSPFLSGKVAHGPAYEQNLSIFMRASFLNYDGNHLYQDKCYQIDTQFQAPFCARILIPLHRAIPCLYNEVHLHLGFVAAQQLPFRDGLGANANTLLPFTICNYATPSNLIL